MYLSIVKRDPYHENIIVYPRWGWLSCKYVFSGILLQASCEGYPSKSMHDSNFRQPFATFYQC